MANLFTNKKLPKRIAVIYKDLRNVTSKLHRTAGSIGFIKKALYHDIIPKFARVTAISLIKKVNINLKEAYFVLI